jgi:hypothetical protein
MTTSSPYSISSPLDLLAPVRKGRGAVAPPSPDIAKPTSAQLSEAMAIIAATGWLDVLEPLMPYALRKARGLHPGGRKPEMTIKALLVGFLLLAMMERPLIIRDVQRMLDLGIDSGTRKHLGLDPKRSITERMVSRCYALVTARLNSSQFAESNAELFDEEKVREFFDLEEDKEIDEYEYAHFINEQLGKNAARMENFIRAGLRSTHPEDAEHEGDYHLDGTYISSWENRISNRRRIHFTDANGVSRRRYPKPEEKSDPDASWFSKSKLKPTKKKGQSIMSGGAALGYVVSAVTWAEKDCGPNVRGADIPYLIDHLVVHTARMNGHVAGSDVLALMVGHHEKEDAQSARADRVRGDLLADREYSRSWKWQERVHTLGFTPHFALAKEQIGHTSTLPSGALIIDGIAYSPGMPMSIRQSLTPQQFTTRDDRAYIAAYNNQRKPYRLRINGNRRADDGSLKLYCPASNQAKAAIACSNKPASLKGSPTRIQVGTALAVITHQPSPAICSQTTVTIAFSEVPFWQPYIPGTPEHQWSYHRRSIVESAFSRIKDEAGQSLRRGTYRVMGKAKVSLAVLFNAMASNIVEVKRWRARQAGLYLVDPNRTKKERTPRRHTRARIASAARRAERQAAKAGIELLEREGLVIDMKTGEILEASAPPGD